MSKTLENQWIKISNDIQDTDKRLNEINFSIINLNKESNDLLKKRNDLVTKRDEISNKILHIQKNKGKKSYMNKIISDAEFKLKVAEAKDQLLESKYEDTILKMKVDELKKFIKKNNKSIPVSGKKKGELVQIALKQKNIKDTKKPKGTKKKKRTLKDIELDIDEVFYTIANDIAADIKDGSLGYNETLSSIRSFGDLEGFNGYSKLLKYQNELKNKLKSKDSKLSAVRKRELSNLLDNLYVAQAVADIVEDEEFDED